MEKAGYTVPGCSCQFRSSSVHSSRKKRGVYLGVPVDYEAHLYILLDRKGGFYLGVPVEDEASLAIVVDRKGRFYLGVPIEDEAPLAIVVDGKGGTVRALVHAQPCTLLARTKYD